MPKPPKGFLSAEEGAIPPDLLSFSSLLDAWRREYARRFAEFVKGRGKPAIVAARAF
jgi:hypothetical protein